ncbi:MAG: MarR family transcriptional regulator, partial [Nocardioidaceae bacterium]|nr:MarR family transcriptional regulator [Nocardioidaceae bacterium]
MSDRTETATLREFNRTWTQRVGVLEESFLGTGRPLNVARLLFEIGPDGAGVRELRDRLDLDSGYLTRLLRRLTDDGLVELRPDPADRRRRLATLTPAGRASWRELDERSEELAARLVAPLTPRQRGRLIEALATANLLVRAATTALREVGPDDPVAREAAGRYFAELDRRFPGGFDPG